MKETVQNLCLTKWLVLIKNSQKVVNAFWKLVWLTKWGSKPQILAWRSRIRFRATSCDKKWSYIFWNFFAIFHADFKTEFFFILVRNYKIFEIQKDLHFDLLSDLLSKPAFLADFFSHENTKNRKLKYFFLSEIIQAL